MRELTRILSAAQTDDPAAARELLPLVYEELRELAAQRLAAEKPGQTLLALDEALQKLAAIEPAKAKLVELRYFAGLTGEQAAEVLGISPTTADRHWAFARAWLQTEVRGR